MTKKELIKKLESLGDIDKDQKKHVVCALIGHANILTYFFGYHYCARCGEQVGDSLGGCYENDKAVYVGHACEICETNYTKLNWKDKFLMPNKKSIFTKP